MFLFQQFKIVQARLPFYEGDNVVAKRGAFDFSGVFHKAGKVSQTGAATSACWIFGQSEVVALWEGEFRRI